MKQLTNISGLFCIALVFVLGGGLFLLTSDAYALDGYQEANEVMLLTAASNGGPQVRMLDPQGEEITSFFAYPSWYRGEFNVATGDIDGDGDTDIVTAPGQGFGSLVRVFSSGGNYFGQFLAYDEGFRGGVSLATGDIDGDGTDEIITGPTKGAANILIWSYRNGSFVRTTENFFAYDTAFRGGVNIGTGDIDGDGTDEIVTAPNVGPAHYRIFGKRGNHMKATTPGFMAYTTDFRGGANVALGDIYGTGKDYIITGTGPGGGPHVKVYGNQTGDEDVSPVSSGFFAFSESFRGGVDVAAGDTNLDGKDEIITTIQSQDKPRGRTFDSQGKKIGDDFLGFAESFQGGVNVEAGKIHLKSKDTLIYSQGDGSDNNSNAIIESDVSTKYTLQTQFKLLDRDTTDAYTKFHTTYFGVYLRYQDSNNWMRVDFMESYRPADTFWARLLIRENGAFTPYFHEIKNYDIDSLFTEWHKLMVVDTGKKITAYLDNTAVMEQAYSTDVEAGHKGYFSNICTRTLWDNLTLNASESRSAKTLEAMAQTLVPNYGLDISRNRYQDLNRCKLSANPYNELAHNSNYSLPLNWTRGSGLWILINDDRVVEVEEKEAEAPELTEVPSEEIAQGTCERLESDCVDLQKTFDTYDGVWETETGDSVEYGKCKDTPPDSTRMVIEESGMYELYLDWYSSAAKMVFTMQRPSVAYLGTWHGDYSAADETVNLGWLDKGDHLVFGQTTFWHGMGFGPYDSDSSDEYKITQLSSTSWDILMDEGVHYEGTGTYNDAHFIVRKADADCSMEDGEAEDAEPVTNKLIYAQGDGTDNNHNAIIKPDAHTNYSLTTKFKLLNRLNTDYYTQFHTTYTGVYLRYEDALNWMRVDFLSSYRPAGKLYARLLIREDGSFIAPVNIPVEGYDPAKLFSAWHDLAIVDTGSRVTVSLDDVELFETSYTIGVKAGMKGYLSNIATRSVWEDMEVVSLSSGSTSFSTDFDSDSPYWSGLDVSSYRYNDAERYKAAKNPYYKYTGQSGYALPKAYYTGGGLWLYMDASMFQ